MARISGMLALPGVPVADARAAQGLTARPEAHTGRVRIGIEVAGQHHVQTPPASALLHELRGSHGLQLALMLEVQLPIGQVVDEQQRPDGVWCKDLRVRKAVSIIPCSTNL